jgi:hypothetical protein
LNTPRASLFTALLLACPRSTVAAERQATPLPPAPATVITVSLAQDFGLHGGADVCSAESQIAGDFACFRRSKTQYHGTPLRGQGGDVAAAPQPATTRLLLGYDRVLAERFTLGARVGYVLRGGGPRQSGAEAPAFLPLHVEARAGYTFGMEPLRHAGLRVAIFIHAGVAQVDTEYTVSILEDTSKPPPVSQLDNADEQVLSAYKKSGTGFIGAGAAVTYAVTPSLGFSAGLKLMQMFPSSGTILSPELACFAAF